MRLVRIWMKTSENISHETILRAFQRVCTGAAEYCHVEGVMQSLRRSIQQGMQHNLSNSVWILDVVQRTWQPLRVLKTDEHRAAMDFSWMGEPKYEDEEDDGDAFWRLYVDFRRVEITLEGWSHGLFLQFTGELDIVCKVVGPLAELPEWGGSRVPLIETDAEDRIDEFEGSLEEVVAGLRGASPL
jgi:hypothetical protein